MEEYSPYVLEDGLVSRVKRYKDLECSESELICTEEHYKNRADKLSKITIDSGSGFITEYFEEGREDCVKSKFASLIDDSCQGHGTE